MIATRTRRTRTRDTADRSIAPCCATCAHARVIPDVRPMEWRCRGGHTCGGLVYRGDSGALSQSLSTPRECEGYVRMG